jgi:hypothetical protein
MQWSPLVDDFSFDYGTVPVGETRTQRFTLTAIGGTVRGLAIRFESYAEYDQLTVVSNTCGRQLRVDEPCDLTIEYRPVSASFSEARIYTDSRNAGIKDFRVFGVGEFSE